MTLDLYLDHDSADSRLVDGLRGRGIHVLTSLDAGNARASDEEQLAFATAQRRMLYTSNARDFTRLHYEWIRTGKSHPGVVIRVHQETGVGLQISALARICESLAPLDAANHLIYLESWLRAH